MNQNFEKLPSGKTIRRQYDDEGKLIQESHSYGMLDIGITIDFTNGVKSSECYTATRRIASRRAYEKARANFPDMPAADADLEDFGAELLRMVAQEKKQIAAQRKSHTPNADRARENDEFCRGLMGRGKCADAVEWIREKGHRTLGERSPGGSRRLVDRFVSIGCPKIYACEIGVDDDGEENTGHLVVELPKTPAERVKTLKAISRLASQQGLQGDPDDGQRYAYIKLD